MSVLHSQLIPTQPVNAAEVTLLQVLVKGPNFTMRRFIMNPGGSMPEHTNTLEHEQYILGGHARISIDGREFEVQAGDVVFIPEGVPHSYRNLGEVNFEFLCIIPNKLDEIKIVASNC